LFALATTYGEKDLGKEILVRIKECTESKVYLAKQNGFEVEYMQDFYTEDDQATIPTTTL
jgi:hypothetical protein